ncbi:MAG: hypothetical protein GY855_08460 [candidate division Zixibacteria bacterium]|nr:hypothetical protein [candidate division Zixibacteria bacterium]
MSADKKNSRSVSQSRISRKQRAGLINTSINFKPFLWVIVVLLALITAYYGADVFKEIFGSGDKTESLSPERFDSLRETITATAVSFGVNPEDIRWAGIYDKGNQPVEFVSNEVRLSSLYPKMLFHSELMMELLPTGFQISDCVESEDGKALDFKLHDDEEHMFEFILVSDNRTKPLASHLTLIIDNIQANTSAVVNRFLSHKAVYGYILTPGVKGFTRTRETLAASEQQTIYDIPLQEDKFQSLMNAAASIVGLKKIRNFQQAITVLNKLTGNFRYLYIRDDNNTINAKMAEELGKAGYVILSEEKDPKGEIEAFLNAGGKIITGLTKIRKENRNNLQRVILEHQRKMLLANNWEAVVIDGSEDITDDLKSTLRRLSQLNCKVSPVSQFLLRLG